MGFAWRGARLPQRHNRQVTVLNIVTIRARPFLHRGRRAGIRDLGLQGELCLNGLGGLGLNDLILLIQYFEFFKSAVELKHDEDQRQDTDHRCHTTHVNWEIEHEPILIVIEFSDKRL